MCKWFLAIIWFHYYNLAYSANLSYSLNIDYIYSNFFFVCWCGIWQKSNSARLVRSFSSVDKLAIMMSLWCHKLNKPIPQWGKNPALMNKVQLQGVSMINFTNLFRASANSNIVLEDKNFFKRSSSAFWSSPPVWITNGLNGDESFRCMLRCLPLRAYF